MVFLYSKTGVMSYSSCYSSNITLCPAFTQSRRSVIYSCR
nr:MAG TPA: hypothetical protein [Caudoviricetes sp.]